MLSIAVVERAIASSIMTQHHIEVTVTCPPAIPRKAGFGFTCNARLAVGTYPIRVTETNKVLTITDKDAPHLRGKVIVVNTQYIAYPDESGKFEISELPPKGGSPWNCSRTSCSIGL